PLYRQAEGVRRGAVATLPRHRQLPTRAERPTRPPARRFNGAHARRRLRLATNPERARFTRKRSSTLRVNSLRRTLTALALLLALCASASARQVRAVRLRAPSFVESERAGPRVV